MKKKTEFLALIISDMYVGTVAIWTLLATSEICFSNPKMNILVIDWALQSQWVQRLPMMHRKTTL